MSRSYRKTIAFGKATSGKSGAKGSYGYMLDDVKKAHKNGTPVPKGHWRGNLQTKEDYVRFITQLINNIDPYVTVRDMRIRKNFFNYVDNAIGVDRAIDYYVNGIKKDELIINNLIKSFAYKIYKIDKSR